MIEEAAETVHTRGAAAAAAELAELAVRLTPPEDGEDVRRRVLDCADRHREAGDGSRAIALLEQALETAPPGLARAAVLAHLANAVADLVDPLKAVDLNREALAEAEGDAALEAEIYLNLAGICEGTRIASAWRTPSWPLRLHHVPAMLRSGAGRWRALRSNTSAAGEAFRSSRWRRRSRSSGRCRMGR